jgi:hypothetical protein
MTNKHGFVRKCGFSGSALVYGLVIMFAVSVIASSLVGFIVSHIRYGFYATSRQSAFEIAESGVQFYRWYLAHSTEGKTAAQIQAFWSSGNVFGVNDPYEGEYTDPGGSALGRYHLEVTPPQNGSTLVTVISTGWTYKHPDAVRKIQVRFRRPSWSEYVLLGNQMQRVESGTDVNGKVFVNNGVRFDGVAHNTVSAAVSTYYDADSDVHTVKPGVWTSWADEYNTIMQSPVFTAGKTFPDSTIDFTGVTADLSAIKTAVKTGVSGDGCGSIGCYFDGTGQGRHIILKSNGTFTVQTVQTYANPGNGNCKNANCTNEVTKYQGDVATYTIPDNGAIYVESNIWLEGTLSDKRVTIVAATSTAHATMSVYIQKNIVFAHQDGSETLGVIAEDDIDITRNSSDVLTINAVLLAQNGRVGRTDYGNTKSTITVYGAIATNKRYGFDTDGTGYTNRNLYYDNNLLSHPPPYFPTGSQYEMDLWEEL